MRKLFFLIIAVAWAPFVMAAGFNPGTYPFIYRSGAAASASPTAASGVITANPAGLVTCTFFNSGAATEYFTVYDSATVAGASTSNILAVCQTSAHAFCSLTGPQPSHISVNGAWVAKNGLSWADSANWPGPTGSPDPQGWAECLYIMQQ